MRCKLDWQFLIDIAGPIKRLKAILEVHICRNTLNLESCLRNVQHDVFILHYLFISFKCIHDTCLRATWIGPELTSLTSEQRPWLRELTHCSSQMIWLQQCIEKWERQKKIFLFQFNLDSKTLQKTTKALRQRGLIELFRIILTTDLPQFRTTTLQWWRKMHRSLRVNLKSLKCFSCTDDCQPNWTSILSREQMNL